MTEQKKKKASMDVTLTTGEVVRLRGLRDSTVIKLTHVFEDTTLVYKIRHWEEK